MKIAKKILPTIMRRKEVRDMGYIPYKRAEAERDFTRVYLSWPQTR